MLEKLLAPKGVQMNKHPEWHPKNISEVPMDETKPETGYENPPHIRLVQPEGTSNNDEVESKLNSMYDEMEEIDSMLDGDETFAELFIEMATEKTKELAAIVSKMIAGGDERNPKVLLALSNNMRLLKLINAKIAIKEAGRNMDRSLRTLESYYEILETPDDDPDDTPGGASAMQLPMAA